MHGHKRDMDFDKRAATYDNAPGSASNRFYSLLLAQVELEQGAAVLDVGCGTGTILSHMAERCTIDGYGLDASKSMVEQAKRKCPDMDIRVGLSDKMPFEDATFDTVTACLAYHHFADQEAFASEAARVLKPGGRLHIADPRLPAVPRKMINGFFWLIRVVGRFDSPRDVVARFSRHGFRPVALAKDRYAQVVTLQLVSG
ncbi:MAG: class I SAM-dependent methyltransferase [Micrococcales bacterium]|nr:class I SAM-dependent methyltransferase [Micrococcales bacterium]